MLRMILIILRHGIKLKFQMRIFQLLKKQTFLVYGSLSSRDLVSRNTLEQLLAVAKYKIFDVNLRVPHYTKKNVLDLLHAADFIKFNDDELNEICEGFKFK